MKKKIAILLLILGVFSFLYFKPFSNANIIILEHMTEYSDGKVNQICLVENPPNSSKKLEQLINEFNDEHPTKNGLHKRLFIKEHAYEFPFLPFSSNTDYRSTETTRDALDNIDFLGDSYVIYTNDGDTLRKVSIYP
ncbi:MAG: hypothetical protein N4A46_11150 [Schleiferiaceae bacterium]|nr:hypothetical protein [Schleiferiaceae bacterium]